MPTPSISPALLAEWLAAEQEPFSGWDFSYLHGKMTEDEPPWDYLDLVRQAMHQSSSALDIGTGGGERLLTLRDAWPPRMFVTEGYLPNAELARRSLGPLGVQVFAIDSDLKQQLPFADGELDLVINRHSGFNLLEIARVLRPGGVFLTQQVDGNALADLQAAFDTAPKWPWSTLASYLKQMRQTSLQADRQQEWCGHTTFSSVASLVYFLKAVPWEVEDFSVNRYLPHLIRQQQRLERENRLIYRWKLFLLSAVKQ